MAELHTGRTVVSWRVAMGPAGKPGEDGGPGPQGPMGDVTPEALAAQEAAESASQTAQGAAQEAATTAAGVPDVVATAVGTQDIPGKVANAVGGLNLPIAKSALGGTDLDTVVNPGFYSQTSTVQATTARHYPVPNYQWWLIVEPSTGADPTLIRQTLTSVVHGVSWWRTRNAGVWSEWMRGVPSYVLGTSNLDDVQHAGFYRQDTGANATVERNYPVTGSTGSMLVVGGSLTTTAVCRQTYYAANGVESWHRSRTSSPAAWTAWEKSAPAAELPTPNRVVLRDAAGRAKVADPAVADDVATKGYVDTIAGAASAGNARTFALVPGSIRLQNNVADMPALNGGEAFATAVVFRDLTETDWNKYFNAPMVANSWLGGNTVTNGLASSPGVFGITTDSPVVQIEGSHGTTTGGTIVLVDGRPVDEQSWFRWPTYSGHRSAIRLRFPNEPGRLRTIEVVSRFSFQLFRTLTGFEAHPFKRIEAPTCNTVGVLGDSWIAGTSQGPWPVSSQLVNDAPVESIWWVSAIGGSGFTVAGQGESYLHASRLGVLAARAPKVFVPWGTINDYLASDAQISTAADTIINTYLAARPDGKILFTGHQSMTHASRVGHNAVLAAKAAADPAHVFFRQADQLAIGNVGPTDGGHPSAIGTRRIARWLRAQVDSLLAA